ncbi:MAG: FecR domain-containing protein, partial [Acidobacteriota bacterium]|nr:FecR domain-containing protein [Acidobacteriota bacterium]
MRSKWVLVLATAVLLPLSAFAQSDGYYDRSYTRMSFVQGDVYVQRAQGQGYEQGQINLVVVEGDKLGTKSGRLETQLGRGNYLRLDSGTQVDVAGLPMADGQPTKFHVLGGSVYIRVATLDREKNFEIHTPDASFYILREGLYRVDVQPSGETVFGVLEGAAEGAGQEGSIVIEEGQRVSAADGRFVSEPSSLVARRDDFSAWNDTRDALFAQRSTSTYLPAEYVDYETELDSYGSWVNESDYGSVWVPRGVDASWRPYSNGRWVWYPIIGWTWVSYDPWGWSTHHYGRWGWGAGLGWYWIPRDHWRWGPAWVDWWGYGDYYGWCPLSYWDRPAYIFNNRFYGRYDRFQHRDFRGFDRSMTVVRRDQLHNRNIRDVAIGAGRLGGQMAGVDFRGGRPGFASPTRAGDAGIEARASAAFSGRGARTVDHGYAGNGTRLSAGEIRSSGSFGRSGAGQARSIRSYPSQNGRNDAFGLSSTRPLASGSRGYSSPSASRGNPSSGSS